MQAEIEKLIFNICTKVQDFTKDKYLHKMAVKIFAKKNKFVLSLKSLLILQKMYPESEEYISSLEIFNQYFQENSTKLKENVINILKNYLPILFNNSEFEQFIKNGTEKIKSNYANENNNFAFEQSIYMIKDFTYFPGEKKIIADVEKVIFDELKKENICLRKVVSEKSLFLEVFLSIFSTEEISKKFKVTCFSFIILLIIKFISPLFFYIINCFFILKIRPNIQRRLKLKTLMKKTFQEI